MQRLRLHASFGAATMTQRLEVPLQPAMRDEQEVNLLIADVATLTGVPPPQLRSWEQAGLLHPRRSPNGIRLYGIEDVARVRLIKRSLVNPGRRGSLRRLATQLAAGALVPAPEDYAGLLGADSTPVPMAAAQYWQAVVDAMADLVVVCDTGGRMTYANPSLRALLSPTDADPHAPGEVPALPARASSGAPLPAALEALPLRWAARTGTQHRDVALVLHEPSGAERRTLWTVTPLRDEDGALHGAVGVGRVAPLDPTSPAEWLAGAAHDLRSPVTNILGRLQLARRAVTALGAGTAATSERQQVPDQLDWHLARAEVSTIDLIRMMDTLLDASAIANGALIQHLEPEGVALDLLAQQAVEHAQQHTTRHVLTLEVATAPLPVAGDRQRLRQVLDNLLANAVKYSPDGGPITVCLEEATSPLPNPAPDPRADAGSAPPWVMLRVTDPGLGIPAEAIPYVFDRHWRADGATRDIPGTGLGLYTCRAIVAAHGGHIWVERSVQDVDSDAEEAGWHGTVMALLLPLAAPSGPIGVSTDGGAGVAGTAAGSY